MSEELTARDIRPMSYCAECALTGRNPVDVEL